MTKHLHLPHPHIADLFIEHMGGGCVVRTEVERGDHVAD